ncbi:PTS sugar transporter subunit IIA [Alkalibaculum sp. M08DMB]|uniref:PTS sugar transporter subunit IIA n=1 Tax=Alkalibaculum sporogenes TaxID=2655001 RepID=A0A6A7K7A7_9FIRM|nr:PTS sugar transporter subunit IIA [Alkalibaculum sporogenes]MPW25330.1 PTS sugar transporter subunit IIA [Alkalibaculum sporogenes]
MKDLGLEFDKDLVLIDVDASSDGEAIEKVATHLLNKGLVKESYIKAIMEREKVFPTGLPTEGYGVAVPHTDVEHVIEQAICIATLKNPVPFKVMGSIDEMVDVKVLFMLALKEPHSQLEMLQAVIGIVQKPDILEKICTEKDTQTIFDIVKYEFENIEE